MLVTDGSLQYVRVCGVLVVKLFIRAGSPAIAKMSYTTALT